MSLNEKISDISGLPKDITMDFPKMTVLANTELTVENFKGIIEYTDKMIRLNTKTHILKIEGERLGIKYITRDDVMICGKIEKTELI